jgi:hypothetical protein
MKKITAYFIGMLLIVCMGVSLGDPGLAAEHKEASLYMMRMINDARKFPETALAEIKLKKTAAQANLGTDAWVLDQGAAPVAWNNKLYISALAHAKDMAANLYYTYDSLNGYTIQDRISAVGYDFVYAGESLGALSFDKFIDPIQAAEIIFKNMLAYELKNILAQDNHNILNDDRTEAGIAFVSIVADLGLSVPVNVYLVVADFANPVVPRRFIVGNVSVKTNDSPEYKISNAIAGQKLELLRLSNNTVIQGTSGVTGFFQFGLPFGFLFLDAKDNAIGKLLKRYNLFGMNENVLVDIFIDK